MLDGSPDAVAEFAGTGWPERDGGHALFPDIRHVDLLHAGEDLSLIHI